MKGQSNRFEILSGPIYQNGDGLRLNGILYEEAPFAAPKGVVALRTPPDAAGNVSVVFAIPEVGKVNLPGDPVLPTEVVTLEIYGNRDDSETQGRVPLLRRAVDATEPFLERFVVPSSSTMATMNTFTVTLTRRGRTSEFSTHGMTEAFVWPELNFGPTTNPNILTLTWPESDYFTVEKADDLLPRWRPVDLTPTTMNGMARVDVPLRDDVGGEIFRLKLSPSAILSALDN